MTFLVQFRSTMGLIDSPVASWAFAIRSMCLRESNTECYSNIMLMMLAKGVEITLGVYFINSLLVSGPGARPLLRHPSACTTSAAVSAWLSGCGLPMKGASRSSDWSENCFATVHEWHQLCLYPFLYIAILGVNSQRWGMFGRFHGLNCLEHFVAVIS